MTGDQEIAPRPRLGAPGETGVAPRFAAIALPRRHRLLQQITVERFPYVGYRLEPPFAGAGREILRLVDEILFELRRDLRLPLHPAQRLLDHGPIDVAARGLLLLGVDGGSLGRFVPQELERAIPAAEIRDD